MKFLVHSLHSGLAFASLQQLLRLKALQLGSGFSKSFFSVFEGAFEAFVVARGDFSVFFELSVLHFLFFEKSLEFAELNGISFLGVGVLFSQALQFVSELVLYSVLVLVELPMGGPQLFLEPLVFPKQPVLVVTRLGQLFPQPLQLKRLVWGKLLHTHFLLLA